MYVHPLIYIRSVLILKTKLNIFLLFKKLQINEVDEYGTTLLHKAIKSGYRKTIEKLIEKGLDVNAAENSYHMTPLHFLAGIDSHHSINWTEDDSLSKFPIFSICRASAVRIESVRVLFIELKVTQYNHSIRFVRSYSAQHIIYFGIVKK